ncbi:hypothetical protein Cyrtocomes_00769 [Candidatus Cyrtobacter comes]|uniref:Uncharacterized protein n=1 Tax=Candidatus Cyrtobacter comes TaxID=675776 RepID=A0ABU5L8E4_9RICK|nr:hypothetical protein [Candidatus Cyrtobacter comes]MDZ5762389.1 hypothetical protein [Candidatus Cyrtobacter comes]
MHGGFFIKGELSIDNLHGYIDLVNWFNKNNDHGGAQDLISIINHIKNKVEAEEAKKQAENLNKNVNAVSCDEENSDEESSDEESNDDRIAREENSDEESSDEESSDEESSDDLIAMEEMESYELMNAKVRSENDILNKVQIKDSLFSMIMDNMYYVKGDLDAIKKFSAEPKRCNQVAAYSIRNIMYWSYMHGTAEAIKQGKTNGLGNLVYVSFLSL